MYVHGGGVRRIGDRSRGTDGGSGEGGSAARKAQIAPDCRCRRLRLPPLSGRTRTHQQHGVGFGGSVPLSDSGLKGNVHSDERSMSVVGHLKERQMKKGKADQVSNRSGEGRRMGTAGLETMGYGGSRAMEKGKIMVNKRGRQNRGGIAIGKKVGVATRHGALCTGGKKGSARGRYSCWTTHAKDTASRRRARFGQTRERIL